jgi:hypothetical protein
MALGQETAVPPHLPREGDAPPAGRGHQPFRFPVLPYSPPLNVQRELWPLADLLAQPATAPRRPGGGLFRRLRQAARALILPWLRRQTLYNQTTVGLLHQMNARFGERVADLERHVRALGQQVGECWLVLHGPHAGAGVADLPRGRRHLETVFAHTRMRRPPGRLLTLGGAASAWAVGLAGLGFRVVAVRPGPETSPHPNLRILPAPLHTVPLPDGSADVVVALAGDTPGGEEGALDEAAGAEAGRLLGTGGQLLLAVPFGRCPGWCEGVRVWDRAALDHVLRPFRVRELSFGVRAGEAWSLTANEEAAAGPADRVGAVALVMAEKA